MIPKAGNLAAVWDVWRYVSVDLMKIIDLAPGKVDDLAFSISEITGIIETAVPPARDFGDALDDVIPETIIEDVEEVDEAIDLLSDNMAKLATDIGRAFGQLFLDIVDSGTTFKEDMAALWGNIKMAFFNMIADMIAEWVTGFIARIVTTSGSASTAIAGIGTSSAAAGAGMAGAATSGLALASTLGALAGAFILVGGIIDFFTGNQLNIYWEEQRAAMLEQRDMWIEYGYSIREANDRIREHINLVNEATALPEIEPTRGRTRTPGANRPGGGFAEGGIAWNPQVATVAEKGPELIIPIDQIQPPNNQIINITLQLDGTTLAEVLAKPLEEQARLGRFYTEQQNFIRTET